MRAWTNKLCHGIDTCTFLFSNHDDAPLASVLLLISMRGWDNKMSSSFCLFFQAAQVRPDQWPSSETVLTSTSRVRQADTVSSSSPWQYWMNSLFRFRAIELSKEGLLSVLFIQPQYICITYYLRENVGVTHRTLFEWSCCGASNAGSSHSQTRHCLQLASSARERGLKVWWLRLHFIWESRVLSLYT